MASPSISWFKGNIDGLARGTHSLSACGDIFRNENAIHVDRFYAYLSFITALVVEMSAPMITLEKAMKNNWKKVWTETDCSQWIVPLLLILL